MYNPQLIKSLCPQNLNMRAVLGTPIRKETKIRQKWQLQRRAARFVFNDYSRTSHVTPMLSNLWWHSLKQRRLYQQSLMFYKIHQGLVGISFPNDVLPLCRESTLRNLHPFRQIQCNNNTFKYSFYPRTIVTWNNLPLNPFPSSLSILKTLVGPAM